MKLYINRKGQGYTETVDDFSTTNKKDDRAARLDARLTLAEYCFSDKTANYYLSHRACKGWN